MKLSRWFFVVVAAAIAVLITACPTPLEREVEVVTPPPVELPPYTLDVTPSFSVTVVDYQRRMAVERPEIISFTYDVAVEDPSEDGELVYTLTRRVFPESAGIWGGYDTVAGEQVRRVIPGTDEEIPLDALWISYAAPRLLTVSFSVGADVDDEVFLVDVTAPLPESVVITPENPVMGQGDYRYFAATVSPLGAEQQVSWEAIVPPGSSGVSFLPGTNRLDSLNNAMGPIHVRATALGTDIPGEPLSLGEVSGIPVGDRIFGETRVDIVEARTVTVTAGSVRQGGEISLSAVVGPDGAAQLVNWEILDTSPGYGHAEIGFYTNRNIDVWNIGGWWDTFSPGDWVSLALGNLNTTEDEVVLKVTPYAPGNIIVRATARANYDVFGQAVATVILPTGITITTQGNLPRGGSRVFEASVEPAGASQEVVFDVIEGTAEARRISIQVPNENGDPVYEYIWIIEVPESAVITGAGSQVTIIATTLGPGAPATPGVGVNPGNFSRFTQVDRYITQPTFDIIPAQTTIVPVPHGYEIDLEAELPENTADQTITWSVVALAGVSNSASGSVFIDEWGWPVSSSVVGTSARLRVGNGSFGTIRVTATVASGAVQHRDISIIAPTSVNVSLHSDSSHLAGTAAYTAWVSRDPLRPQDGTLTFRPSVTPATALQDIDWLLYTTEGTRVWSSHVESDGVLRVGVNEPNNTLVVRAMARGRTQLSTATQQPSVFTDFTVTVRRMELPPSIFFEGGTTQDFTIGLFNSGRAAGNVAMSDITFDPPLPTGVTAAIQGTFSLNAAGTGSGVIRLSGSAATMSRSTTVTIGNVSRAFILETEGTAPPPVQVWRLTTDPAWATGGPWSGWGGMVTPLHNESSTVAIGANRSLVVTGRGSDFHGVNIFMAANHGISGLPAVGVSAAGQYRVTVTGTVTAAAGVIGLLDGGGNGLGPYAAHNITEDGTNWEVSFDFPGSRTGEMRIRTNWQAGSTDFTITDIVVHRLP